jgi:hypothetical protein
MLFLFRVYGHVCLEVGTPVTNSLHVGKAAAGEPSFDSDDDKLDVEELSKDREPKRRRHEVPASVTAAGTLLTAPSHPPPAYTQPWQWMQPQWLPQPQMAPAPWAMSGPPPSCPYPEGWTPHSQGTGMVVAEEPSAGSLARGTRRQKKAVYDDAKVERRKAGKKPHNISVTPSGEIDAGCSGKNSWDSLVRTYVPRILDMSVIDWEKQRPEAVQKLRETLDHNFEYLGNELSVLGFRNAVKRYLKTERSRLKAHLAECGPKVIPSHVYPDQWERLLQYWGTEKQQKKAETMSMARKSVKNFSSVGRKGRAGKEAALVISVTLNLVEELVIGC